MVAVDQAEIAFPSMHGNESDPVFRAGIQVIEGDTILFGNTLSQKMIIGYVF